MTLSLIAALASNRAIGYRNQLLYHMPADLRHFKALTTGHTVIMGRHTFESLPKGALPNRRNVVLSRQQGASFEGAETFPSLELALEATASEDEVFVIGGASVYSQTLPLAGKLYLTLVDDTPPLADAFFPAFDGFVPVASQAFPADDRHPHPFKFVDYVRP